MLESYVFAKSNANSGGTTVSTIGSTANFDQINDIIYREVFQKDGELSIHRQLYIENGFDTDKAKKLIKTETDKVMFIPSDDPTEHPGITFIYKPEFRNEDI